MPLMPEGHTVAFTPHPDSRKAAAPVKHLDETGRCCEAQAAAIGGIGETMRPILAPMGKPVIRRGLESPRNETGFFKTWKRR
jgi:hypothetical protein